MLAHGAYCYSKAWGEEYFIGLAEAIFDRMTSLSDEETKNVDGDTLGQVQSINSILSTTNGDTLGQVLRELERLLPTVLDDGRGARLTLKLVEEFQLFHSKRLLLCPGTVY
jgi:hypothetical protein